MVDAIGFHCNACGKCCNSPPAMSIPELFRHRRRFIGSLAVGQARRLAAGSRIGDGAGSRVLDADDAQALAALQDALLHPSAASGRVLTLVTQAVDYPSLARCPALAQDGGCTLHGEDKPRMCSVVPLDPLLPDRLQDSVLRNRRAAAAWTGTSCIQPGAQAPYRPLVRQQRVVDPGFGRDLQERRSDMAGDKTRWGRAVATMLEKELRQGGAPALRDEAALLLPLVPVLAVLAAEGEAMRAECIDYIDCQQSLIEAAIGRALARRQSADRATTAQLRGFAQAYARQRVLLAGAAA